jgi:hypothetical protein
MESTHVTSESNFSRENLYCLVAIAFFIWRAQSDIRYVTTSPLSVSKNNGIEFFDCLTPVGGSVDIYRIGWDMAVRSHLPLTLPFADSRLGCLSV